MKVVLVFVLAVLTTAITLGDAFAVNLMAGDYEIKNWVESANGGTGKLQKHVEHIGDPEVYFTKMFTMERCKQVSKSMVGNTLTFELACEFAPPSISGRFTFNGDSFEGKLRYGYNTDYVMMVGMRGTKIEAATQPKPPSAEKLAEIDKKLQGLWSRMKSYLSSGDIDKALELFHPDVRKDQRILFEELKKQDLLPTVVNDMIELKRQRINEDDGHAIYELVSNQEGHRIANEVVFQKDQDDNWVIVNF